MSRPKSLNWDQEIHQDLKIWAFLNSLSWSWSRSAWIFAFSCQDFSIRQDFSIFIIFRLKRPQQCWDFLTNLDASWQISTIWTKILTRQNLDWKVSILKISTKKKNLVSTVEKISILEKSCSRHKDNLDLDWSQLSRPPGLFWSYNLTAQLINYL